MSTVVLIIIAALILIAAGAFWSLRNRQRPLPPALQPGSTLPDFTALTEDGEAIESRQLRGSAAVILFVRGNWCPFCSAQVKNLAAHYKSISDLGARLLFITPKPLATTRRVADFFDVDFEFWLDQDLRIARQFDLVRKDAVPNAHREEYGEDTVWPTALVVDSDGIIRFAKLSKFLADRPNPEKLLQQLTAVIER